jgi:hypothetical protein
MTAPGMLSFYWRVSSEPSEGLRPGDELQLIVCGATVYTISGETDWVKVSYYVDHQDWCIIEWRYVKNSIYSAGQDKGWIDDVVMVRMTPTPALP